MTKNLTLLGSTGSIGVQSLDVARKNNINITALSAGGGRIDLLEQQAREFKPKTVAVFSENGAKELKSRLRDTDIKVLSGEDGVIETAVESDADTVLNAIVGIAGLKPTVNAIKAGKNIALANKETLVTGGKIVLSLAKEYGVSILPVDSEHSAIFQCLQGVPENSLKKILLTASGGPFFGKTAEELKNITPKQALMHPNWDMGAKITIDSATLMNKGLEVIEAVHLFGLKPSDIEVLVHRQSIVHSAVELCDGAVIAQLGVPDMKLPIQYALTYPDRTECLSERLDLSKIGTLTFDKPDFETFLCLKTCIEAINEGKLKPVAANGANEVAVKLFLDGKIKFPDIGRIVKGAADNQKTVDTFTLSDIFDADNMAREFVYSNWM